MQERYLYDQLLAGLQNQEETIGDLYPDTEMIQTAMPRRAHSTSISMIIL